MTRVYPSKAHSASLLQSITEAGFLAKVAAGMKGAATAFKAAGDEGKKPSMLAQVANAHADAAKPQSKLATLAEPIKQSQMSADSSKLARLATEATQVSDGEVRYAIYARHADLKLYLQPTGGHSILQTMENAELQSFSSNPRAKRARIAQIDRDFLFSEMITPSTSSFSKNADHVIIVDVPQAMDAEIRAGGSDETKTLAALTKIMDHRYYVMIINITRARKIADGVDAAEGLDELVTVFDPNVVAGYPVKQIKVTAINEWDAAEAKRATSDDDRADAKVDSLMKQASRAERAREAEKSLSAGTDKQQRETLLARITGAESDKAAADLLAGMINDKFTKDQAREMLKSLNVGLNSPRLTSLISKL